MGQTTIKITQELVTPEIAKMWLGRNGFRNRKLSEKNVQFLTTQMVGDAWEETGDTIKVTPDGKFLDGQHRLHAIVRSGKPQRLFIAKGVKEKAFNVLDTGKTRSAADVVSTLGVKNSMVVTHTARGVILFERDYFADPQKASKHPHITNAKIVNFVQRHRKELEEIAAFMTDIYHQFPSGCGAVPLAVIYYMATKKNQTKADKFFGSYGSGIDLSKGSPIRLLRDKFMLSKTKKGSRIQGRDVYAMIILAWNAFLRGKELSDLRLRTNYEFPKMI